MTRLATVDRRRRKQLDRELEEARARLASTRPEDYAREIDYRRLLTNRLNKVRRLEMMLREE